MIKLFIRTIFTTILMYFVYKQAGIATAISLSLIFVALEYTAAWIIKVSRMLVTITAVLKMLKSKV